MGRKRAKRGERRQPDPPGPARRGRLHDLRRPGVVGGQRVLIEPSIAEILVEGGSPARQWEAKRG
jgi:hypothetical protein